jgi:nitrogen fixation NifU-like protein
VATHRAPIGLDPSRFERPENCALDSLYDGSVTEQQIEWTTQMYSKTIRDHALNPRNRREMKEPDAVGEGKFPRCGDKVKLYFRIQDGTIVDASFTASACGPAIAAASLATTMLKGRTLAEARKLGVFEFCDALGGLPVSKRHAILLVLECLAEALEPQAQPKSKPNIL